MKQLPTTLVVPLSEVNYFRFFDGGGDVLMAFSQSEPIPEFLPPVIKKAVEEIQTLLGKKALYVMINRIPAGVEVEKHTDTLKRKTQRWHFPIKTNKDAWYWDTLNARLHMEPGFWHGPIPYWIEHQTGNKGLDERIHLVVDLEP